MSPLYSGSFASPLRPGRTLRFLHVVLHDHHAKSSGMSPNCKRIHSAVFLFFIPLPDSPSLQEYQFLQFHDIYFLAFVFLSFYGSDSLILVAMGECPQTCMIKARIAPRSGAPAMLHTFASRSFLRILRKKSLYAHVWADRKSVV